MKLSNYQQAINDCERGIELDPKLVQFYIMVTHIYSIQNNATMACQFLKKAIEKGFKE
jgi:hypothetical protein